MFGFCKNARTKIKSLIKNFDEVVIANAGKAIAITTLLRKFLQSPVGDVLTAIIPGDWDNLAKERLVIILFEISQKLQIVETCNDAKTLEDKVNCYVKELAKQNPKLQNAILFKMASILLEKFDGNRLLDENKYDAAIQVHYTLSK
jgi:hypothetical protein